MSAELLALAHLRRVVERAHCGPARRAEAPCHTCDANDAALAILDASVSASADGVRALEDARKKLAQVVALLEKNGCDCECDHHPEEHDDDCERCIACRIGSILGAVE